MKEVFDHLRSALDYAARGTCDACVGGAVPTPVYFPIVSKTFRQRDFRSRLGKLMPGVAQARPDVAAFLESVQPFSSVSNHWLADFTTLCNESKHEQLSVTQCTAASGSLSAGPDGELTMRLRKSDGSPFNRAPLLLMRRWPADGMGECEALYIAFAATGEELLWFLDQCVSGVGAIVGRLKALAEQSG